jgi:hypothetical protein
MPDRIVIAIVAPPKPLCFTTHDQWVRYLTAAMNEKKPERRPFRAGAYRPNFTFCKDCPLEHRKKMLAERRCEFDAYVEARAAEQEAQRVAA